jgi:hypothetical protein
LEDKVPWLGSGKPDKLAIRARLAEKVNGTRSSSCESE